MKKLLFTFALGTFFVTGSVAQSNLNMEAWTGNECDEWGTLNSFMLLNAPQTTFQEQTDPGEGLSSARITTGYWLGATTFGAPSDTVSGIFTLGEAIASPAGDGNIGLPCTSTPDSVSFMYKADLEPGDTGIVIVQLSYWDALLDSQMIFAQGSQMIADSGDWQTVTIPVYDFSGGVAIPDTLQIICASSMGSFFGTPMPIIGSTIYVDNFFVPNFFNVGERDENVKFSVYPNPSSDDVVIKNGSSKSDMDVEMIDINGKLVRSYTDVAGGEMTIDGNGLARGSYFVKVTSGGKQVIKQVIFQ